MQNPSGNVNRQWNFNHLQINDFVITPDATQIVAVTTSLKRVPIENKLKPSLSTRPSEMRHANIGVLGEGAGDLHFSAMEHSLMVIRLSDKEIAEWVVVS